jgi:hypothetical protein
LVLSLFLILFVLSFIVAETSRWAAPGGWGLATGTAGAIALLTLLWFRGRPLTATDEGTAVKAWRESLFVGIGVGQVPAMVGFVGTMVARRLTVYLIGLAFSTIGLLLVAPSRWNVEHRQRQLDEAGVPVSLGSVLTRRPDDDGFPPS